MTKANSSSDVLEPASRSASQSALRTQWTLWDQTAPQFDRPQVRADGTVAPENGQQIGRYEVVGRVGSGGMGQVYRAHDPELQRIVAIKVHNLHPGPNGSMSELRDRLMREGRALACISDPNVVTVYDVGLFRGQVFVAMELIRGCDLKKWISAQKRSPRQIVETYLGAAAGLAAVHRVGVVHRDVKPANFVVGNDGRVRVVDFGLACLGTTEAPATAVPALTNLTQPGIVMGTPAYIAPEQLAGMDVDARCDQFSFCVALWEALSGASPFAGATMEQRAEAIERGVLQGRSRIPCALRAVLERGLRAEPERRHESMVDLAQKLRSALDRPRRIAIATAALTLLVGALVALWSLTSARPLPHHNAAHAGSDDAQDPTTFNSRFERAAALYMRDDFKKSIAVLETMISDPRLVEQPLLAADSWELATALYIQLGNDARAQEVNERSMALATKTNDDEFLLHGWITRIELDADDPNSTEFWKLVGEARALASRLPGSDLNFDLELAILLAAMRRSEIDAAKEVLETLRQSPFAQEDDSLILLAEVSARIALTEGDFVTASREAQSGLEAYARNKLLMPSVSWALMATQATALAQLGQIDKAEAIVFRIFRELRDQPTAVATRFLLFYARVRVSLGFGIEAQRAIVELESSRALEPGVAAQIQEIKRNPNFPHSP